MHYFLPEEVLELPAWEHLFFVTVGEDGRKAMAVFKELVLH